LQKQLIKKLCPHDIENFNLPNECAFFLFNVTTFAQKQISSSLSSSLNILLLRLSYAQEREEIWIVCHLVVLPH
jgi:hypothetical protein